MAGGSSMFSRAPKSPKMVDSRQVSHSKHKLYLWIIWLVIMVTTAAYCAMSIVTFGNVQQVYTNKDDNFDNHELWSLLTASLMGPIVVIGYFVFGTLLMMKKTMFESGTGYSYGALQASTGWMALFIMQCAVTMHSFKKSLRQDWDKRDDWKRNKTDLLVGTFTVAYILSISYIILFFVLIMLRNITKHLDLTEPEKADDEGKPGSVKDNEKLPDQQPLPPAVYPPYEADKPADKPVDKPADKHRFRHGAKPAPPTDPKAVKLSSNDLDKPSSGRDTLELPLSTSQAPVVPVTKDEATVASKV